MESDISGHSKPPSVELGSQELDHSSAAASWQSDDYSDHVLYDTDGQAFRLSDVEWSVSSYFYDLDSNDSNIIKNDTSDAELVPAGRAVAMAVFMIMFSVAVVANALLVYTVVRYRAMRRGTNLYFLNILAADLVYLLVCLPTVSVSYALVDWRFGNIVCQLENYVMSISLSVQALTILAAGVHQCLTNTYPNKSGLCRSTKAKLWMLGFVWILSCAVMAPRTVIFGQTPAYHRSGPVTLCGRKSDVTSRQIDSALMFLVFYLLPLLMSAGSCWMLARALWQGSRTGFPPTSSMNKADVRCRRRSAKMIFAITAVFAVAWLPLHVYQLVEDFDHGNILLGEYIDRGTVALFISLAAKMCNPIVFCLFNRRFAGPANGTFTCKHSRTGVENNTSCTASKNLGKAEVICPSSVLLSLPVTPLSDMLPSRHDRMTSTPELTLAESPSSPDLQPLLKKQPRIGDSKCRSGVSSRPDSWSCAKDGPQIKSLGCPSTPFMAKDGD